MKQTLERSNTDPENFWKIWDVGPGRYSPPLNSSHCLAEKNVLSKGDPFFGGLCCDLTSRPLKDWSFKRLWTVAGPVGKTGLHAMRQAHAFGKPEKRTSLRDTALMDGNLKLFGPDFVANPHCRGPGRTRTTLKWDEGDWSWNDAVVSSFGVASSITAPSLSGAVVILRGAFFEARTRCRRCHYCSAEPAFKERRCSLHSTDTKPLDLWIPFQHNRKLWRLIVVPPAFVWWRL